MWLLLLGCLTSPSPEDSVRGLACDSRSCGAGNVCLVESYEPACTNLADTGETCPDGTTRSMCGGAGIPCCCGATPDETFSCATCDGEPSCDCVTCPGDKACEATTEAGVFRCAELPKP